MAADFLESGFLVGGEEGPRAVVEDVGVELSLVVVESEGGSVHSDDISDSLDDRQVFESLSVEHQSGIVTGIPSALLALDVERWVHNLEGADVSVLVGLVWESGINHHGVEVLWLGLGQ